MAVDIDSDLDTPVPHLLLNIGRGDSALNQQRTESVSQIVEPEFPQPSLFERRLHVTRASIEGEILVGTFHPEPEENFKATHSAAEFKK